MKVPKRLGPSVAALSWRSPFGPCTRPHPAAGRPPLFFHGRKPQAPSRLSLNPQNHMSSDPQDYLLVIVTGYIAWHGITWKDKEGKSDFVRLLFGSIALLFCMRFLFVDLLNVDLLGVF